MQHELSHEERRMSNVAVHPSGGTIIVASDGSDASGQALVIARQLADRLHAAVEVVSVLERTNVIVPSWAPAVPPLNKGDTRIQDRRARLRQLYERVLAGRPEFPTRIVLGDVVSSIAMAARERDARLVVVGRVPHGRIERAMRRETALGTVRAAHVPVLAVPATMTRLPRCVVVAVGHGEAAARLGLIAPALFAEAIVIHLVSVKQPVSLLSEREFRLDDDEHEEEAQRAFAKVRLAWDLPADVPVQSHVVAAGAVSAALSSFASSVRADLVVAGMADHSSERRLSVGEVATRVFRTVACASLLVPVQLRTAWHGEAPTFVSRDIAQWPAILHAFTRRNLGRTATLEVDEQGRELRHLARGWGLTGVDCDPHTGVIEIMLADPTDGARHLSHPVAKPQVLAIHGEPSGCDEALVVGYEGGQFVLTLR